MGAFPELFQTPPTFIVTRPVKVFAPVAEDTVRFPLVPAPTVVVPVTVNAKAPTEKVAPSAMERLLFIVRPVAVVVVPAVIVSLLKEVKKVLGSVFVVVSSTVPVPGVQVPPLLMVKPWQVRIPPLVISMLRG